MCSASAMRRRLPLPCSSGTAAAAANAANERLKLDHSDVRSSALARGLAGAVDELLRVWGSPLGGYEMSAELMRTGRTEQFINESKVVLGMRWYVCAAGPQPCTRQRWCGRRHRVGLGHTGLVRRTFWRCRRTKPALEPGLARSMAAASACAPSSTTPCDPTT